MKRLLDIIFSVLGLLLILPFLLLIALWIKLDSAGSIFFRQQRIGLQGREFILLKFRTMAVNAEKFGQLTIGNNDCRVTRAGRFLRRYKLDEIPQLVNVLLGDMSMVGPRPEVKKYVQFYNEEQRKVLNIKPGITDLASITYKNENELLSAAPNPEEMYINVIMPDKIRLNMNYINNPSISNYLKITFQTIYKVVMK